MYKILSIILLSRLTPYAEEIIGDHQCGLRRNRSAAGHIFCLRQILEKKWEYNEAVTMTECNNSAVRNRNCKVLVSPKTMQFLDRMKS
jgi:hypothetical protein